MKEFQDLSINEESLEPGYLSIFGDHEFSGYLAENLKSMISKGKDLPVINPFFTLRYSQGKELRVFPSYEPMTGLEVMIKDAKPIFNGACSLVLADYDGKRFVFFDPTKKHMEYQRVISQKTKIKLAAVANGSVFEMDFDDEKIKNENFLNPLGLATTCVSSTIIYESSFDILNLRKKIEFPISGDQGNFLLYHVKNPIDATKELELLTNDQELDNPDAKRFHADYYFIGSLEK